jgi:iron complex transport system substrate-binding protein
MAAFDSVSRALRHRRAATLAATLAYGLAGGAWAGPASPRVVSLNPCLDGILLEVADRSQIAALSRYARDPAQSATAAAARGLPTIWGSAEEVVALSPDLVLTGAADPALTAILPRLHIRQAVFGVADSLDQSFWQVRRVAALVGHPERGESLIARIEAALAAAEPRAGEPRLGALIYQYHGLASGPGTLVDDLLRRTGFDNLAPHYGLKRTGEVPLEVLITDPPHVLLAGRLAPGEPVWADRILSHPALASLSPRMKRETFPEVLMFCGGPSIIPAAAALAKARENALAGRSE